MRDLSHIGSCFEVTDEDIAWALRPATSLDEPSPRERMLALLARMAVVATPRAGGPKILMVIAHMAGADWLEGDLAVGVQPYGKGTEIRMAVRSGTHGTQLGKRLRVAAVPYREFAIAVAGRPDILEPLRLVAAVGDRGFTLRATAEDRRTSMPPPISAIDPDLFVPASARVPHGFPTDEPPAVPREAPRRWDPEAPTQRAAIPVSEAVPATAVETGDIDDGWD